MGTCADGVWPAATIVAYFQQRFKAGHVGGGQDGFRRNCRGSIAASPLNGPLYISTAAGPANKIFASGVDRVESGLASVSPVIGSRQ